MLVAESEAVAVSNSTLTMTYAPNAASVINIPGSSRSIVVRDDTLSRPANAIGNFVHSETASGNTIGPNVERNN